MKKHLISALAIFFIVALTGMHAQIKAGYVFGVNFSTITLKLNGLSSNPETPLGVHFGGCLDIPLRGNFTLRPELLLSAKGSNFKIDTVDITLSPIYIEVPVLAVYSFGSDAVKISLFAGPYFACGIGGYKIISGGEIQNLSFGSGENKDLKLFDIGFSLGAGVNINGLLISAQYGIGMANLLPVATIDSEMKNKVIGISISSSFPGK